MAYPERREGRWRRARRQLTKLPGRTPLRVKLLAAVLALVVIALGVISLAGVGFLRQYIVGQENSKLQVMQQQAATGHIGDRLGGQAPGQSFGPQDYVYMFLSSKNTLSTFPGYLPNQSLPTVSPGAAWLTSELGHPVTVSSPDGQHRWRVVANPLTVTSGGSVVFQGKLIIGIDVTSDSAIISNLIHIDMLVSLLVLFGVGIAGMALVRASLHRLNEIEETAEAIAAGDLSQRVPDADPRTEVGSLGQSLNTMLTQIEAAFAARTRSETDARNSEERMRRFVADASHELRTPLTTIRGFAEYYRQRGGVSGGEELAARADLIEDLATAAGSARGGGKLSHAELDRLIRRVEQEATRMGVLVEDLLLLARLDQQRPLEFRTVDLLSIAADSVHDARVIAPARAITLTMETSRIPLVIGDEVRLRQVVGNLVNNALTHTPDGTAIEVTISAGTLESKAHSGAGTPEAPVVFGAPGPAPVPVQAVVLKVADHGPGLNQEQAEHVFERFYRTDRARTRAAGGTGLGLAIVAALVAAHHGRVWVESAPGSGTVFGFALPLSAEALGVEHDEEHDEGAAAKPQPTPTDADALPDPAHAGRGESRR